MKYFVILMYFNLTTTLTHPMTMVLQLLAMNITRLTTQVNQVIKLDMFKPFNERVERLICEYLGQGCRDMVCDQYICLPQVTFFLYRLSFQVESWLVVLK